MAEIMVQILALVASGLTVGWIGIYAGREISRAWRGER